MAHPARRTSRLLGALRAGGLSILQAAQGPLAPGIMALPLVALSACTNGAKKSAALAAPQTQRSNDLATQDLADVRKGMPQGAKRLGDKLFAKGAEIDPRVVREELQSTRSAFSALQVARSTFFALTDANGVAYASDLSSDGFAGKNLLTAYPALAPAAKGQTVEGLGSTPEARGVNRGDDAQWVYATPVQVNGAQKAIYVTGWSWRRYALRLQDQLLMDFHTGVSSDKPTAQPLLYVFVLVDNKAYGAPLAPDVDQQAVEGMNLLSKLQGDTPWQGTVEVNGYAFGVAARRAKPFGDHVAFVILRAEV